MNASTTTLTIRIPVELKDKLGRIAEATRRSQSYLAAEALTAHINRELEIIEGIQRGLDDVAAGRTVPHEEAMAQIRSAIAEAQARKA